MAATSPMPSETKIGPTLVKLHVKDSKKLHKENDKKKKKQRQKGIAATISTAPENLQKKKDSVDYKK